MKKLLLLTIFICFTLTAKAEKNIDIQNGMVHLNSAYDYQYVKDNFPKEVYQQKYQELIGENDKWLNTKKLAEDEVAVVDKTHRVIEVKNEITGEIRERYQQEYKEDPNCKLFKLGFTVEEVTIAIKDDVEEGVKIR